MPKTPSAATVLYARDISRVGSFHAEAAGLPITHREQDYVVPESGAFQAVVVAVPRRVAATIRITEPPQRRESTAIKLVFRVIRIAAAREAARLMAVRLTRRCVSGSFKAHASAMATTPRATSCNFVKACLNMSTLRALSGNRGIGEDLINRLFARHSCKALFNGRRAGQAGIQCLYTQ